MIFLKFDFFHKSVSALSLTAVRISHRFFQNSLHNNDSILSTFKGTAKITIRSFFRGGLELKQVFLKCLTDHHWPISIIYTFVLTELHNLFGDRNFYNF